MGLTTHLWTRPKKVGKPCPSLPVSAGPFSSPPKVLREPTGHLRLCCAVHPSVCSCAGPCAAGAWAQALQVAPSTVPQNRVLEGLGLPPAAGPAPVERCCWSSHQASGAPGPHALLLGADQPNIPVGPSLQTWHGTEGVNSKLPFLPSICRGKGQPETVLKGPQLSHPLSRF